MKKILEITSLAKHELRPGGIIFAPGETKELLDDAEITAFEGTGENTLDDGSPAFKIKEKKITKKEEEKKIEKLEKAEAKKEGGE